MACAVTGISRSTYYYQKVRKVDEEQIVGKLYEYSVQHPRRGYRKAAKQLQGAGVKVGHNRVQRLRRQEGLQVRKKQHKTGRVGQSTTARQQALYPNHVWSWDFIFDRTEDGRSVKILNIVDEFSRFNVTLEARRSFRAKDVRAALGRAMVHYGIPGCIRSDNGSEFIADIIKKYLEENGIHITYIEPGSPWQNGYVESLNARLRDECLNRELFTSLLEAQVVLAEWQREYNEHRPHGALKYKTPASVYGCSVSRVAPNGENHGDYRELPKEYSSFQLYGISG
jgi:transposase InsO family protein